MTAEEEVKFRAAARAALVLADGSDIAMVIADGSDLSPAEFTVLKMGGLPPNVALFIPEAWATEEGTEDRLQAIIRQEGKALSGEALD